MSTSTSTLFRPGVLHGQEVTDLLNHANENDYALPAVNVIGTNSINAVLETAKLVNSPVMIQFSNGGGAFYAGKGLDNTGQRAAILGSISGAGHVHHLAEAYGVTVLVHTDHCAKNLLPWIDGLLDYQEKYFDKHGHALYSSHMLDLSEEPLHENIEICASYLRRMKELGITLEIELGVTGGEEDGVDNTGIDNSRLYTQPEEVAYAYETLGAERFKLVADNLEDEELSKFYKMLWTSEAKHGHIYVKMALNYFPSDKVYKRLEWWVDKESDITESLRLRAALH